MADDGWARYMRDHDIPAEGYPPPAMDWEEEEESDEDDYYYERSRDERE